jgi:thermostable 8-oxoguanine DNA glycosylase
MWKTARAKKHYLKNIETVTSITKEAFKLTDDKSKIIKLCELKGVSVPVASAILTVIYPKSYGVIDIRCLQMLNQLGYTFSYITMPNNYIKYLHTIREIAKENNITPREVDKILFAMHREELMKKQYKNLYK